MNDRNQKALLKNLKAFRKFVDCVYRRKTYESNLQKDARHIETTFTESYDEYSNTFAIVYKIVEQKEHKRELSSLK